MENRLRVEFEFINPADAKAVIDLASLLRAWRDAEGQVELHGQISKFIKDMVLIDELSEKERDKK